MEKSRINIYIKRALLTLFSIVVVSIFSLFVLIYTPLSLTVTNYVLNKTAPEIKIAQMSGTLNDLTIHDFLYQSDNILIQINNLHYKLNPFCLLKLDVCFDSIDSDGIYVSVSDSLIAIENQNVTIEPESPINAKLTLPVDIKLNDFKADDVRVYIYDDAYKADNITFKNAKWVDSLISATHFSSENFRLKIVPTKETHKTEKAPKKQIEQTATIKEIVDDFLLNSFVSDLPDVFIPVDVKIDQIDLTNSLLNINNTILDIPTFNVSASVIDSLVLIDQSDIAFNQNEMLLSNHLSGSLLMKNSWPVELTVMSDAHYDNDIIPIKTLINGSLLKKLSLMLSITGENDFDLFSIINLDDRLSPFNISIKSKSFQWPFFGAPTLKLQDFSFVWKGKPNEYQIKSQGNIYSYLSSATPKKVEFHLNANGNSKQLDFNQFEINLPQGKIVANSKIDLNNNINTQTNIKFVNADFSGIWSNFDNRINGKLNLETVKGYNVTDDWHYKLSDTHLDGMINNNPFKLNGLLNISKTKFSADQFNFRLANNKLQINGHSDQQFNSLINFNELTIFHSSISGKLNGKISITKKASNNKLITALALSQFKYQGIAFKKISLNSSALINFDSKDEMLSGNINLAVDKVSHNNFSLEAIKLSINGNETNHALDFSIMGNSTAANLSLSGSFIEHRQKWISTVKKINLTENDLGELINKKTIAVEYNQINDQWTIDKFCMLNKNAEICLNNPAIISSYGDIDLSFNHIDVSKYKLIENSLYRLSGIINGSIKITWDKLSKIPMINGSIVGDNLKIVERTSGHNNSFSIKKVAFNSIVDDKSATISLITNFDNDSKISANIQLTDPTDSKLLKGSIAVDDINLNMLNVFLGDDNDINGLLFGDLSITGTLDSPQILGELKLNVNNIQSKQLVTNIKNIALTLNFYGNSSKLAGNITTTNGPINIQGNADWHLVNQWASEIKVIGESLEIGIPSVATFSVNPDIRITANPNEIDIDGKIIIPTGDINIEQLPASTVNSSSDEVMLDANLKPITVQTQQTIVNSKLLISLGNNIKLNAYGLNAKLKGDLFIQQSPQELTGNGTINIRNGTFKAYGQDLIINSGAVIFAGPIDNPRLSIEAVRNPNSIQDNVTAGVKISGFASEPNIEVFSNPTMPTQEVLSYLLRGEGFDSESQNQNQNDMIFAALVSVGTSQGGQAISNISEKFGVKDLYFDTSGSGNQQKVVVTGKLTQNLQIKYAMGVFDALTTFTLRYQLIPRFFIEMSTGANQTVDLIYQFDI